MTYGVRIVLIVSLLTVSHVRRIRDMALTMYQTAMLTGAIVASVVATAVTIAVTTTRKDSVRIAKILARFMTIVIVLTLSSIPLVAMTAYSLVSR
jgi:hypothetical protein